MPVSGSAGATATQYVLSYAAANSNQCQIEVSENPNFSSLVHAVDQSLFKNANLDGQTTSGSRVFVVGQKWIAQENAMAPSITVASASRVGNLVTVNYANSPFIVGDNIIVGGMSNPAYNDSWSRIEAATSNSFTYSVLTSGTDASGGGIITRANRYSLALGADTTYYYRIGGVSNTCGANPPTGSFTTMNIPNGNTWSEGSVRDNNGDQIEPTVPENRAASLIDPLTGAQVFRLSLNSDANASARGWSSSFFRPCSLTPSSNGSYHCIVGMGNSGTGGLYSVKSTGETHWLGFMHANYTDSAGHHCCNQGTSYFDGDSSPADNSNPNVFYRTASTNGGMYPSKAVIIGSTFTGSDNIDALPGADWSNSPAVALTPDPNNTLFDKLGAFDPNFSSAKFGGCTVREVSGDYATGFCNSAAQGSPAWVFAFKISTASVAALGPMFANPTNRWCGSHGTTVNGSQKWTGFGSGYMTDQSTGVWDTQLTAPITNNNTFNVTAPGWQAATIYSGTTINGTTIVDSNNNLEVATVAGTSGNLQPQWNAISGGVTKDGTVTWTNGGAASNIGEPQNIYARQGSNGNYWSFLMPAKGAVGSGGPLNGDLFHFEDGTNECVRLITKGSCTASSCTWSVTRAEIGNSLVGCASSPQPHAAGARLRALCEPATQAQPYTALYWDFVDDPHMTDTTNTSFVRQTQSAGHGYAREPGGGIWNTFLYHATHNPFTASDFTTPFTFGLSSQLTFNNLLTTSKGVSHQDYTTWDFENASFKDSAIGSLYFVTGGGTGGWGTYTKVTGTNTIYKYILGSAPFSYTLPYVPSSGGHTLPDISGPNSRLLDIGSNQVCVAVVPGECWPGSSAGDMYASLPGVANLVCNSGNENASFMGQDWCMMNTSTYGDSLNQYGLLPANFIQNDPHGVPYYGAGLSRRLVQNLAGGLRLQGFAPHTVPDGSGALFQSCIADPHIQTHGGGGNINCQVYLAHIPPQPPADGIDRTNFENVSVNILPSFGGATHARVKYGYEENEAVRSPTWPRTIHFYCTQYKGTCYSANQNLPLNSKAILPVGVPQRVLYYQVEYLDSSNTVVATDPVTTTAIP